MALNRTLCVNSAFVLGLLLAAPSASHAATPLTCPPGTQAKGKAGQRQWCTKPNGRRHGPTALWHADGKLATKTIYRNGAKVALIRFHQNGKRQLKVSYRAGVPHGPWEAWYTHGVRSGKGTYKMGVLEGRFTLYHFSGARSETGNYKRNKRVGTWTFWHKNGKKALSGAYVDGLRDGAWVEYDKQGKKLPGQRFARGKLQR
jgi:antitoxin component YwqK of YwqJK toxin-antitoxin module